MPLGFPLIPRDIGKVIATIVLSIRRVCGLALKMEAIMIFGREKFITQQEKWAAIAGILDTVSPSVA
jgi:hypothetical protein